MMGNQRPGSEELLKGKIPGEGSGIEIRKTICDICNPQSYFGIDAYVKDGVVIKVEGTQENPHPAGTLCSKGAASRQYIYHQDRIRTPYAGAETGIPVNSSPFLGMKHWIPSGSV